MINQARSLILNDVAVNRPPLGALGEEYVPEEYRRLDYAGTLQRVRDKLLGTSDDPLYENYRLAELMAIMHASQYSEELLLTLDSRYTYRPFKSTFMPFDFSVEVEEIDDKDMSLTTGGTPIANDATGRALYRWTVRTAAGPIVEVKEFTLNSWKPYDVTVDGTEVSPVTLENGVVLQLATPPGGWQIGAGWLVTSMSRVGLDLGLLVAQINSLGASTTYDLFIGVPSTFKTLWYEGVSLVDQLSGLLGSFVYKAEEIRQRV